MLAKSALKELLLESELESIDSTQHIDRNVHGKILTSRISQALETVITEEPEVKEQLTYDWAKSTATRLITSRRRFMRLGLDAEGILLYNPDSIIKVDSMLDIRVGDAKVPDITAHLAIINKVLANQQRAAAAHAEWFSSRLKFMGDISVTVHEVQLAQFAWVPDPNFVRTEDYENLDEDNEDKELLL